MRRNSRTSEAAIAPADAVEGQGVPSEPAMSTGESATLKTSLQSQMILAMTEVRGLDLGRRLLVARVAR